MAEIEHKHKREAKPSPERKKGIVPLVVALVVLLAIVVAGIGYFVSLEMDAQRQQEYQQEADVSQVPDKSTSDGELPDNPVDFPKLKSQNPDIYSWISIPGTQVNYPVVQHASDDFFYLKHDIEGNSSSYGCIFSQSMNATDFSDPVTVLYGHYSSDGQMFGSLHDFEDPTFFNEHEDMYIYMPGHILTYRIIAAYQYDDRHIMNSFDFSDPEVRARYFDSVLHPTSMVVNVREGVTLGTDDKLLQLSTCPVEGSQTGLRYIVTGVLVDDQQTK